MRSHGWALINAGTVCSVEDAAIDSDVIVDNLADRWLLHAQDARRYPTTCCHAPTVAAGNGRVVHHLITCSPHTALCRQDAQPARVLRIVATDGCHRLCCSGDTTCHLHERGETVGRPLLGPRRVHPVAGRGRSAGAIRRAVGGGAAARERPRRGWWRYSGTGRYGY